MEAFQIFPPFQKELKTPDPVLRGFKRNWRMDEMSPDLEKPKERFQNNQKTLTSFASSSNVFFTEAEKINRGVVLEKLRKFKRVPNFEKMVERSQSPIYITDKLTQKSLMTLDQDKALNYRVKSPLRALQFDNYMDRKGIFVESDKVTKNLDYHDQLEYFYEKQSGFCLLNYAKQRMERFKY